MQKSKSRAQPGKAAMGIKRYVSRSVVTYDIIVCLLLIVSPCTLIVASHCPEHGFNTSGYIYKSTDLV